MPMLGMITDIQRCSLHDGPGIRTTIFMKGCNLRCTWCHNPETLSFEPEVLFHPERCIHCRKCDAGCFSGARVVCGREMTPECAAEEALQDFAYYGPEGGVTVSGGEPTCQGAFVAELMRLVKQAKAHTAMETNLCCAPEVLEQILPNCDLVMADLKLFDDEKHRRFTGSGNGQIKRNLKSLDKPLILRTPVVCGVNDDKREIGAIADFARELPTLLYYELLPYHPLGLSKGAGAQERFQAPDRKKMKELADTAKSCCAQVRVAGRVFE
jgi:pyruvate formate lyase activating enzyme